ncbi:MAG TPA: hypothetical protein VGO76_11790 [Luteibacter sp.]|nr:hypothetical protein [Luteibacter sp.]
MNTATALIEPRVVASEMLGRIVLAVGEMEYKVGLCLCRLVDAPEFEVLAPIVDTLSLKPRLDMLNDLVAAHFAGSPGCLSEFAHWHGRLGQLGDRRSGFVHGRWDSDIDALRPARFKGRPKAVCHVAELREECRRAEVLGGIFQGWRGRWLGLV